MLNRISLVYFELEFYLCNKVANGAMLLLLLACRRRRAEVAVIGCGFGCPAPCFCVVAAMEGRNRTNRKPKFTGFADRLSALTDVRLY